MSRIGSGPKFSPLSFDLYRCHDASEEHGGGIGAAPFSLLHGSDAPPLLEGDAECDEQFDQYTNTGGIADACWRVLCVNAPSGDSAQRARVREARKQSLLGVNGHIERASAWSHLIGAACFLAWTIVRPVVLKTTNVTDWLATIASVVLAITLAISTLYHTGGTVRRFAPLLRACDHGAIDVALGVAAVADLSVSTKQFSQTPWQTIVDPVLVAVVIIVFFTYRRTVLTAAETEVFWGNCKLGLFRFTHADFEYSALRSAGYICLSFGFVLTIPAVVSNLQPMSSSILISSNGGAVLLLIAGLFIDNVIREPDIGYNANRMGLGLMYSKRLGCICSSHATWHFLSLVSLVVLTGGRECAIQWG
jgi:predicted membrane channel-forming protein YqfA (hemolysin III family)